MATGSVAWTGAGEMKAHQDPQTIAEVSRILKAHAL